MGFPGRAGAARALGGLGGLGGRLGGGGRTPGKYQLHKDGSMTKVPGKKRRSKGMHIPQVYRDVLRESIEFSRAARYAMLMNTARVHA